MAASSQAAEREPPKLAVVIAVDQFRGDYLTRFGPYFSNAGFKRLLARGTSFEDCHYRHAVTKTAPGHATVLTGTHADVHGIIGNDWFDRAAGRMVESVEDSEAPLVGLAPSGARSPGGVIEAKSGRSPRRLTATTVGDQIKFRHGTRSRVVAISNKDRAAILLGGRQADVACWLERGRFVTSTYYGNALPGWVETFNARQRVEAFFGNTWERLLDPAVYERVQGPDDAPGESAVVGLGRTFPHKINGGRASLSPDYFAAFDHSPFSAAVVGELAETAIREERLGRHAQLDLLCVSFSQPDVVGHAYGPDSHEVMDSVLRLDAVLAKLLACLDQEVGLDRCVIVFTADHGASPLPERVQALRPATPAGRFDGKALDTAVNAALTARFGAPGNELTWVVRDNFGYHLRAETLAPKKVPPADAARVIQAALRASSQIAHAFTRAEVLAMSAEGPALSARLRRSFFPERSQDVVFVFQPYVVDREAGTNHGTPYAYDTHVPLVFAGPGVPSAITRTERVGVDDLAPTLAALLGVPPPPEAEGRRLF